MEVSALTQFIIDSGKAYCFHITCKDDKPIKDIRIIGYDQSALVIETPMGTKFWLPLDEIKIICRTTI